MIIFKQENDYKFYSHEGIIYPTLTTLILSRAKTFELDECKCIVDEITEEISKYKTLKCKLDAYSLYDLLYYNATGLSARAKSCLIEYMIDVQHQQADQLLKAILSKDIIC